MENHLLVVVTMVLYYMIRGCLLLVDSMGMLTLFLSFFSSKPIQQKINKTVSSFTNLKQSYTDIPSSTIPTFSNLLSAVIILRYHTLRLKSKAKFKASHFNLR